MLRWILQSLHRGAMAIASRFRNIYWRAMGVRIEGYCWLRAVSVTRQWEDITLEKSVCLDRGVTLLCSGERRARKLVMGSGTYVNRLTIFDAHLRIELGKDVMIGPGCYITDADHGLELGTLIKTQPMTAEPVIIKDGAWIGAGAIVLKGVTIGVGTIVGAGSVVTRSLPDHCVAVGTPAKILRQLS